MTIESRFGDSTLAISDEFPGIGVVSPLTLGGTYGAVHVAVGTPRRPSRRVRLMRYGLFGASGPRVSELFLGAMTFGEQGGVGTPPEECARILNACADAGGNVIDTAINYRGGASEEILGKLLRGRRDQFVRPPSTQSRGTATIPTPRAITARTAALTPPGSRPVASTGR